MAALNGFNVNSGLSLFVVSVEAMSRSGVNDPPAQLLNELK